MKYRIEPPAERELHEAVLWYEEQSPGLGRDFMYEFKAAVKKIVAAPERFAFCEFLPKSKNIRRILLGRFSYLILYKVMSNEVRIVAVAHTSRGPGYWKGII